MMNAGDDLIALSFKWNCNQTTVIYFIIAKVDISILVLTRVNYFEYNFQNDHHYQSFYHEASMKDD